MKVNEKEKPDRFGIYPCCWVSGRDATPQKLQEWLFYHFQGYKFAIILDCTKDEYEIPAKETPIYFLDTLLEEFLEYAGLDAVKEWIKQKEAHRN
ncbi:MAG: hypothetical protein NC489_40410 [Ruminococcus flavefaciens]|nr:hypothetical protein [Ruminococcus flavefaciens]